MSSMKPMLAATPDTLLYINYPVLASPKLDGIRCVIIDGKPMSRKLLSIPNAHVRKTIEAAGLPELDGELMVKGTFQDVTSAIMSQSGAPDFEYHVFDTFTAPRSPFASRTESVEEYVKKRNLPWLKYVPHTLITGPEELIAFEQKAVEQDGFEGIMIRSTTGLYKYGRSTANEGWLLKVKRWTQEEAEVIGVEELMENTNGATTDNTGATKRSSHKSGMRGLNALGAVTVRNARGTFNIGTGFTSKQRAALWQENLVGRTVTFKFNEAGMKDVPRFPVFIGFRDPADMS
jgi:DNA ligase-1